MNLTKNICLCLLLMVFMLAGGGTATATNLFDPGPVVNCTDLNCGARTIGGTVLLSSGFPMPWVAQIAAVKGECLRIEVINQGADLEAVLISPNGAVRSNNRGVAGGLGPLIIFNNIPQSAWYTLQLSHQDGRAVNADFTLSFGRYPLNNTPNCR